jgi:hypothetical protein
MMPLHLPVAACPSSGLPAIFSPPSGENERCGTRSLRVANVERGAI